MSGYLNPRRIAELKLPNVDSATISSEKIRDYLLAPTHPVGRYKAEFFRSLGYDQAHWESLASDLRSLLSGDATQTERTKYGVKYEIRGPITGPNGRTVNVVSAWIILAGEEAPRFVTAYPED